MNDRPASYSLPSAGQTSGTQLPLTDTCVRKIRRQDSAGSADERAAIGRICRCCCESQTGQLPEFSGKMVPSPALDGHGTPAAAHPVWRGWWSAHLPQRYRDESPVARCPPIGPIRTPRSRIAPANCTAVPTSGSSSKNTRFVSMAAGTPMTPGSC